MATDNIHIYGIYFESIDTDISYLECLVVVDGEALPAGETDMTLSQLLD